MTRSPARPLPFSSPSPFSLFSLFSAALSAGALLAVAACSAGTPGKARAVATWTTRPAPHASPTAPVLTGAQARAALITEADLGEPWVPTEGAATWRDALLKAKTPIPDCQRLLDALYADEILGAPTAAQAVTALDDPDDEAQLRYQVATRPPADVDRTLAWLKTLPQKCHEFTATTTRSGSQRVQVTDGQPLKLGDASQSLHVTLIGTTPDGDPTILALDTATVRVGDDAITFTNGGPGAVPPDATQDAARLGTARLKDVQRRGRAQV